MKKRRFAAILLLVCLLVSAFPSLAAAHDPRLVDDANLLTSEEQSDLEQKLDTISEELQFEVVIVTTNTLGGKTPTAYAQDYYDYNNYGYGSNHDGILLLISMEDRDWEIVTTGYGITAFTDAGQRWIMDRVLDDLSYGDYAWAFDTFADQCEKYVTEARTNEPYDVNHEPKEPLSVLWIFGAFGLGAIIALIVTMSFKSQLTSVKLQAAAQNYVVPGSLVVANRREMFLYRNVTRVRKPEPQESSGGGGGSSVSTGSSGTSHGGSGGKF